MITGGENQQQMDKDQRSFTKFWYIITKFGKIVQFLVKFYYQSTQKPESYTNWFQNQTACQSFTLKTGMIHLKFSMGLQKKVCIEIVKCLLLSFVHIQFCRGLQHLCRHFMETTADLHPKTAHAPPKQHEMST